MLRPQGGAVWSKPCTISSLPRLVGWLGRGQTGRGVAWLGRGGVRPTSRFHSASVTSLMHVLRQPPADQIRLMSPHHLNITLMPHLAFL